MSVHTNVLVGSTDGLRPGHAATTPPARAERPDHRAQPSPPSRAIARLLERHGSPVQWLITGHTHRAGERSLAGTTTRSLDTGTWCSDIRGPGPDREDGTRFPYVMLEASATGSEASLRYWHDPGAQHLPAALARGGASAG
jgi:hypothetical protein